MYLDRGVQDFTIKLQRLASNSDLSLRPPLCIARTKKLTPVYPWEVARLRAHIETLVDDLVDRMKVRGCCGLCEFASLRIRGWCGIVLPPLLAQSTMLVATGAVLG